MGAAAEIAEKSFSERLSEFLDLVEYRAVETDDDREEIYRLRYDAYSREGSIPVDFRKRTTDDFDELANVWIFALRVEGRVASSIRVHVASPGWPRSPSLAAFPEVLRAKVEAGCTIVDPTRFVADQALARRYPELPYATVRLGFIASEHFDADYGLATVRAEHRAFYRRVFGLKSLCDPRPYPGLTKPISLMGIHYPSVRESIIARYPFLASTTVERTRVFARMDGAPFGGLARDTRLPLSAWFGAKPSSRLIASRAIADQAVVDRAVAGA